MEAELHDLQTQIKILSNARKVTHHLRFAKWENAEAEFKFYQSKSSSCSTTCRRPESKERIRGRFITSQKINNQLEEIRQPAKIKLEVEQQNRIESVFIGWERQQQKVNLIYWIHSLKQLQFEENNKNKRKFDQELILVGKKPQVEANTKQFEKLLKNGMNLWCDF